MTKDGYINGNLHTLFIGDITLNSLLGRRRGGG